MTSEKDSDENEEIVGRTVEWGEKKQESRTEDSLGSATVASSALAPNATAGSSSEPSTTSGAQSAAMSRQLDQSSQPHGQPRRNLGNPSQDPQFTQNFPATTSAASASVVLQAESIQQQPSVPPVLAQALMLQQMPQQMLPSALAHQQPLQGQHQQQNASTSQMPPPFVAMAGDQGGAQQIPLLVPFLQQQLSQLQGADTDTSNAAIRALMEVLPQLSSMPQIQQQVAQTLLQAQAEQQRRQQELEQQRQHEEQQQEQLVALMGVFLQLQQQPHPENNPLLQIGVLQQLLTSHATSTLPPLQAIALLQLLASQQGASQAIPAAAHPATSAATALGQASFLEVLASTSNQVPPLPVNSSLTQIQGGVTRKASLISGSSDLSSDRSSGNRIEGSDVGTAKKQRRIDPYRRPSSNAGRPANAFADRDANGRARGLPTLLVMPSDLVELSPHQTLLRYQIEVFQAGEEDVATHTRGRNKPVEPHQIGLRCRHCKTLQVTERLRGSVYFPRAVEGFYQAAQNMNSTHLQTGECQMMGDDLRQEFSDLITSRGTSTGAGRTYWAQQARNLGLSNTDNGIRFHNDQANSTS